jgi:predicted ester cyclase
MAASGVLASVGDVRAFMARHRRGPHFVLLRRKCVGGASGNADKWKGEAALRDQFVRPFIAAFAGNRHIVKNMVFGKDIVVVEFSFEADHNGPFAGRAATGIPVKVPGCGVYQFDSVNRKITVARIYFEFATLLKQIASHQPQVLQELLMTWFASRVVSSPRNASEQLSH